MVLKILHFYQYAEKLNLRGIKLLLFFARSNTDLCVIYYNEQMVEYLSISANGVFI